MKLSWKKPQLAKGKILGLFINTFTADDKYSLVIYDNLRKPIQMVLSKKQKTYSDLFSQVFNSRLGFEHFEKKDDPHSLCICEITDCERRH